MNERILELAEQANKQIRHRICPNTFKPIDDPNGPHIRIEFDKEKFAELIVRECINLVKDCYAEPQSRQSPYQTVCASTIIEDHFGVEDDS